MSVWHVFRRTKKIGWHALSLNLKIENNVFKLKTTKGRQLSRNQRRIAWLTNLPQNEKGAKPSERKKKLVFAVLKRKMRLGGVKKKRRLD